MHGFRNSPEEFEQVIPIHDSCKHQTLHVLDLDCDYATDILRQVLSVFLPIDSRIEISKYCKNVGNSAS